MCSPRFPHNLTRRTSCQPEAHETLYILNMLSIQASSKPAKCNVLPCRIKHTGSVEATEKHWIVIEGENGNAPETSQRCIFTVHMLSFSICRSEDSILPGEKIGWQVYPATGGIRRYSCSFSRECFSLVSNVNTGHVLEVTDEKLPSEGHPTPSHYQEESMEEEDISVFRGLSTFDEITIWGHDAAPDESTDGVIRGIREWIWFADKVGY